MGGSTGPRRDREMVALLDSAFAMPRVRTDPVLQALAKGAKRAAASLSPIPTAEAALAVPGTVQPAPEDWRVQVGAFRDRAAAEKLAESVMTLDPRLTAGNERIVPAARRGGTHSRGIMAR